jgi:hypothetical protein
VSVSNLQVFGMPIDSRSPSTCSAWPSWPCLALLAKNLVRGAIGREWMAIRDMDVAAAVIGIRPMYAKLSALPSARSSSAWPARCGLCLPGLLGAGGLLGGPLVPLLFMVIIGGMGSIMGSFFGAAFIVVLPIFLNQFLPLGGLFGIEHFHRRRLACRADDFRRPDRLVPDRGAPRPGQAVVHGQAKAAPVAVPALMAWITGATNAFKPFIH